MDHCSVDDTTPHSNLILFNCCRRYVQLDSKALHDVGKLAEQYEAMGYMQDALRVHRSFKTAFPMLQYVLSAVLDHLERSLSGESIDLRVLHEFPFEAWGTLSSVMLHPQHSTIHFPALKSSSAAFLYLVLMSGNATLLELVLKANAQLPRCPEHDKGHGKVEMSRSAHFEVGIDLNTSEPNNGSLLELAICLQRNDMSASLLAYGADANIHGGNSLHLAMRSMSKESVRLPFGARS